MVAANERNSPAETPEVSGTPRVSASKLVRAAVALLIGLLVTFSGTMHEMLAFDRAVAVAAFALFAVAHLFAWWHTRSGERDPISLILAVTAVASAVIVPFTEASASFAVVIAGWALLQGLFEFIGAAIRPGSRQDSTILGALGVLLAVAQLLVLRDPVAIIGFFGAYALIVGVLLGISAFDVRSTQHDHQTTSTRESAA